MTPDSYPDDYLRDILEGVRTIAVVGASPRHGRPSHGVMAYLQRHGYRAIPVNPNAAGDRINGESCYTALAEVPEPIDMVDVFRRSAAAGDAVDQAIVVGAKIVWMQLGVRDDAAAARAEAHGLKAVMNRCPAIEIPRLGLPSRCAIVTASRALAPTQHRPRRPILPRPRLFIAAAIGAAVAWMLAGQIGSTLRVVIGWDVGI